MHEVWSNHLQANLKIMKTIINHFDVLKNRTIKPFLNVFL